MTQTQAWFILQQFDRFIIRLENFTTSQNFCVGHSDKYRFMCSVVHGMGRTNCRALCAFLTSLRFRATNINEFKSYAKADHAISPKKCCEFSNSSVKFFSMGLSFAETYMYWRFILLEYSDMFVLTKSNQNIAVRQTVCLAYVKRSDVVGIRLLFHFIDQQQTPAKKHYELTRWKRTVTLLQQIKKDLRIPCWPRLSCWKWCASRIQTFGKWKRKRWKITFW